jgi:transposase-like protein
MFKEVSKNMFNLYLNEREFKFNQRGGNMYQIFLMIFRDEPL